MSCSVTMFHTLVMCLTAVSKHCLVREYYFTLPSERKMLHRAARQYVYQPSRWPVGKSIRLASEFARQFDQSTIQPSIQSRGVCNIISICNFRNIPVVLIISNSMIILSTIFIIIIILLLLLFWSLLLLLLLIMPLPLPVLTLSLSLFS